MSDADREWIIEHPGERRFRTSELQPLYLLADSQLLFWKRQDRLLLETALDGFARDTPLRAAYIGASNGDRPEFYEIFEAAVDAMGITNRRMIDSSFGPDDCAFLERAQLIVLAGGDVRRGWNIFEKTGMKDVILGRHAQGAILVGISAGAVQLGRYGIVETPQSPTIELLDVFKLVSVVIDVHDERAEWARLSRTIHVLEGAASGLGIPSGGGVIVHADTTIEPLRRPAHTFRFEGTHVTHSLLYAEEGTGQFETLPRRPRSSDGR
jgi:cyanophycinase